MSEMEAEGSASDANLLGGTVSRGKCKVLSSALCNQFIGAQFGCWLWMRFDCCVKTHFEKISNSKKFEKLEGI